MVVDVVGGGREREGEREREKALQSIQCSTHSKSFQSPFPPPPPFNTPSPTHLLTRHTSLFPSLSPCSDLSVVFIHVV